jgi:hypothetical protein
MAQDISYRLLGHRLRVKLVRESRCPVAGVNQAVMAGVHGSRTHLRPRNGRTTVLKTAPLTGEDALPFGRSMSSIGTDLLACNCGHAAINVPLTV